VATGANWGGTCDRQRGGGRGARGLAATRALRLQDRPPAPGGRLRRAYDLADAAFEAGTADRPLDDDLVAAQRVVDRFAMMDTALDEDVTESE
jgi:hypothetical protein